MLLLSYRRQYPELLYGRKSQTDPDIDRDDIRHEFSRVTFALDSINPLTWHAAVRNIVAFRAEIVLLPWWVTYFTPMYLYLAGRLKKKGIRVVLLCINVYEHENGRLKKLLTEITLSRADALIVHSEQEKAEVLAFNPAAKVKKHLLPLFRYETSHAREQDNTLHLLFFGFVRPYKGLDVLLRAMGILRRHDISLRIAGEFWDDKGVYIGLIDELGISDKVELIDRYVSDQEMGRFFEEADLVVLPYRRTRTSGVIATAYGFAKPVLATDVGGFREVIRDGYTGKIVAPDSPEAIAEGITWFLNHRDVDFAKNVATFAAKEMSWRSLAAMVETS
ncbi:glycosyltransferase [Geobacter sp. OR-1]|uniref:glycosyltransferase n=1 Tax=Geobacter sp. OR-1 TaxID=1266765 RepID=UPI00351BF722